MINKDLLQKDSIFKPFNVCTQTFIHQSNYIQTKNTNTQHIYDLFGSKERRTQKPQIRNGKKKSKDTFS
jgi:hypothetical protein